MIIKYIKNTQHKTIKWVGGTTTQLAIYPETSSYPDRNFLFRISTAKIETEESEFTKLPGVSRKLMILDGEIKIEHKGRYTKNLKKFDQDSFEGYWDTKSYGIATDFNLMTTGKVNGELEAISFQDQLNIQESAEFIGLYFYNGNPKVKIENKEFLTDQGDFMLINNYFSNLMMDFLFNAHCEVIITRINNIDI